MEISISGNHLTKNLKKNLKKKQGKISFVSSFDCLQLNSSEDIQYLRKWVWFELNNQKVRNLLTVDVILLVIEAMFFYNLLNSKRILVWAIGLLGRIKFSLFVSQKSEAKNILQYITRYSYKKSVTMKLHFSYKNEHASFAVCFTCMFCFHGSDSKKSPPPDKPVPRPPSTSSREHLVSRRFYGRMYSYCFWDYIEQTSKFIWLAQVINKFK